MSLEAFVHVHGRPEAPLKADEVTCDHGTACDLNGPPRVVYHLRSRFDAGAYCCPVCGVASQS